MLIEKIQIGPLLYQVVETDDFTRYDRTTRLLADDGAFDPDDDGGMGLCVAATATILVRSSMKPALKRVTLLHECLHAILFNAGMPEHCEEDLDALAHGLVDAFERNPRLYGAITHEHTRSDPTDCGS